MAKKKRSSKRMQKTARRRKSVKPPIIDKRPECVIEAEDLLKYAVSDAHRQTLQKLIEIGAARPAAIALGISRGSFRDRIETCRANKVKHAARRGMAPEFDLKHAAAPGMVVKGTSIRYNGAGRIDQYWNKTRIEGAGKDEIVTLPDPKKITKVSTLYDQEGRATQQWIGEKPEDHIREQLWKQFASELSRSMPKLPKSPMPTHTMDDMMTAYPVGDHHFGMLSWKQETGASCDLNIATKLLTRATDYLLNSSPPCRQALLVFLGDFMHYDSFEPVTPTGRHQLDADGRYPKMVRAAIFAMRYMIDAALRRHGKVHIIVEIGNHDLSSAIFLMECLNHIYDRDPRVSVDVSPRHYHYFRFGSCLIGTHHGHGAKMESLPLIMATDVPKDWGATKHRYIWTGHVHHSQRITQINRSMQKDHPGVEVESFRILPPSDAYSHQKGYRSHRDMKAIVLHKEHGEVSRHTVRPEMLSPMRTAAPSATRAMSR
jgi:hypothetical protein